MIRIAILLLIAAVAALFTMHSASDPGAVAIKWFGYEIETTALFSIIALCVIMALFLPLLRLFTTLIDAPGRLMQMNERNRRKKGQEALALGLIAAEAGEFDDARKHAEKAAELIQEPRLAKLLEARAAEVSGDIASAERAYTGMLQHEDTEILGRKGLLQAALKRGDRTAAMAHAEAALRLSRTATWPFTTLFELKVAISDWEGALDALEEGEKRKLVETKAASRRRAVLLTAAAHKHERERHGDRAVDMALKAVRIAPGFAPAAAVAARLLIAEQKAWKAQAVLEEAWETAPHPAIAHAYRDIKSDEPEPDKQRRMLGLVDLKPEHRESKIIAAEIAMDRGDWRLAEEHLEHAYRENPSSRICNLFATACKGRGDEDGYRKWMTQATVAPREADWSDLDPEGPAFLYDDSDWARLVYVYGDAGQLIHPRMERGGRDVGQGSVLSLPAAMRGEPAGSRAWTPQDEPREPLIADAIEQPAAGMEVSADPFAPRRGAV
jgi:HemY protein